MAEKAEHYFARNKKVGHRPVWQITPPEAHAEVMKEEHDRMAQEGPDPETPAKGYPLTDHGGSTIPSPKLVLVYMGKWWGDQSQIEKFSFDIMTAGFLNPLTSYGSGPGTYIGSFQAPALSGSSVTDAQLQAALQSALKSVSGIPQPDNNTLYALLLPDGMSVKMGNDASCTSFCGYHDAFTIGNQHVYYAVQPSPNCSGCLPAGDTPFQVFTAVLAHEIAEACTDAVPGQGWYNDQTGMENADEWAWVFFSYGPWNIQGYQVNGTGNSKSLISYVPQQQPGPPGPKTYSLQIQGPNPIEANAPSTYSAILTPPDPAVFSWTTDGQAAGTGSLITINEAQAGTVDISTDATFNGAKVASATVEVTVQAAQKPSDEFWAWFKSATDYENQSHDLVFLGQIGAACSAWSQYLLGHPNSVAIWHPEPHLPPIPGEDEEGEITRGAHTRRAAKK